MTVRKKKKAMIVLITVVVLVFFMIPSYFAVLTSFKSVSEISKSALSLPVKLSFANYEEAIQKSDFLGALKNSCLVTFPAVILIVICSAMGGYSIARNSEHRFFRYLDRIYMSSLMIPFQILMIPVYRMFRTLNLLNNLLGMVLILTGVSIAYATFLYVGFIKGIPKELEEAALLDGCGPYQVFFKVVLPLLKPITATVIALHIMWLWNDFNIALILLQKEEVRTLTIKQYYFFGSHVSNYGAAFATAILSMVPVLFFFILAQKYLIEGIAAGAVKS